MDCRHDDIKNYLVNMKKILNDTHSHLVIQNKKDKNYYFAFLYKVTKEDIRNILLSLTESDFMEKVRDRDEGFEDRFLYVWNPVRSFTAANGETRDIELYIKTDVYDEKNLVVVISFHKINDYS